jgi:hypothetical protein
MPYEFRPEHKHELDRDDRRRRLPPHETLRRLGLREGEIAHLEINPQLCGVAARTGV